MQLGFGLLLVVIWVGGKGHDSLRLSVGFRLYGCLGAFCGMGTDAVTGYPGCFGLGVGCCCELVCCVLGWFWVLGF